MKRLILILLLMAGVLIQARTSFTAYPYLAYSSETKIMVGAFSFLKYDISESEAEAVEFDILGNTIYSQNKQFLFVIIPRFVYHDWELESDLLFRSWPDSFYGLGNFTDQEVSEPFTSSQYSAEFILRRNLDYSVSVALISALGWHQPKKVQPDGMYESTDMLGKQDSFHSGLGFSLKYDSSDGSYFPRQGLTLETKQLWHDVALGSDFDFQTSKYDARFYLPIGQEQVLAAQSDLEINSGQVPYYMYPELGARLRAYDSKRFIDKVRISQRIEHRSFPFSGKFSKRIGFVVFGETGQVANDFDLIRLKDWHFSAGAGLRFSILPQERLNLRADIGFGKDSVNFIINAREVF
ncbi:MAG: outer membrane protein assembly factor [Candidatus Cloacimonetes bacterium]|nr:outer membrane protein assembly factor [Candidatus Cloacimonadota bacterium]MCK9184500.1 outer membrane protein assembly factor [Candidatus Cloacimonadota bacterium]MCK9584318.1 outer membrane protein assembly factor [Candidatus Cloacimonadota bacterium]